MFARADTLKVVSNAVREPVMLPGEWGEVYRWVIADENVPDKKVDADSISLWKF